ncbi:MAG: hypothetical protein ACHQFX_05055 [Chitinophagales bacterium]
MENQLVKNKLIRSLALAIYSIITGEFEKKKIPHFTDTGYLIFLTRSAKANIQLSQKVKVTTNVV